MSNNINISNDLCDISEILAGDGCLYENESGEKVDADGLRDETDDYISGDYSGQKRSHKQLEKTYQIQCK